MQETEKKSCCFLRKAKDGEKPSAHGNVIAFGIKGRVGDEPFPFLLASIAIRIIRFLFVETRSEHYFELVADRVSVLFGFHMRAFCKQHAHLACNGLVRLPKFCLLQFVTEPRVDGIRSTLAYLDRVLATRQVHERRLRLFKVAVGLGFHCSREKKNND